MARNKIGLHLGTGGNKNGYGDYIRALDAAGIPAFVGSMAGEGFGDVKARWDAGSTVPHVVVVRYMPDGGQDVPRYGTDYNTAVNEWLNWYIPKIGQDVRQYHQRVITKHGNELDKNQLVWLSGFYPVLHAELLRRMGWASHRICCFSFASGEPEPEQWEQPAVLDFLRIAGDNPDKFVIGLHEYSYADVLTEIYPHRIGRFQKLYEICDKHGIKRPLVAIHEFGWRQDTMPDPTPAMEQIQTFAAPLYCQYETVLGAAIWTTQQGFNNIANKAQRLIRPVQDMTLNVTFPDPVPPDPPTPPQDKPKIVIVLKPTIDRMTLAENHEIAEWCFTHYGRTDTHNREHDTYSMMITGDPVKSRVVIPYPERQEDDIAWVQSKGWLWEPMIPTDPEPEPPPTDEDYLPVQSLNQRDSRWANHVLGQNTGHGKTIGNWGCLLTAYNVMGRYWELTTRLPNAENDYFVSKGCFSAQYIQPGALRTAYPTAVTYDGYMDRDNAQMRPKIKEWLDAGRPVPARVDFNPTTSQWEQHWVLLIGYFGEDFWMADPWYGDIEVVNNRYPISGSDVIEAVFYRLTGDDTPPPTQQIDMSLYFYPPGGATHSDIFTLTNNWGQGPERCQLQRAGNVSYVTKNQSYEKRTVGNTTIALNLDTSPGNGEYYTVDSPTGWMPRMWQPGQSFTRQETTKFYRKSDCGFLRSSNWSTPLTFERVHPEWTSKAGIKLPNVAELSWFANGRVDERYWFAPGLGLVAWKKYDGKESWISELIPRGQQANNVRETGCFGA